jgi:hypothetical protein
MKQANVKQQPDRVKSDKEKEQVQPHQMDEKASIGGDYNSGVTSDDPEEKDQIEKQASLGKAQPKSQKEKDEDGKVLTKENLPDATNESKGKMGSGQRQDSN